MDNMIQVNRSSKHARIEARDKELLIEQAKTLHNALKLYSKDTGILSLKRKQEVFITILQDL